MDDRTLNIAWLLTLIVLYGQAALRTYLYKRKLAADAHNRQSRIAEP